MKINYNGYLMGALLIISGLLYFLNGYYGYAPLVLVIMGIIVPLSWRKYSFREQTPIYPLAFLVVFFSILCITPHEVISDTYADGFNTEYGVLPIEVLPVIFGIIGIICIVVCVGEYYSRFNAIFIGFFGIIYYGWIALTLLDFDSTFVLELTLPNILLGMAIVIIAIHLIASLWGYDSYLGNLGLIESNVSLYGSIAESLEEASRNKEEMKKREREKRELEELLRNEFDRLR